MMMMKYSVYSYVQAYTLFHPNFGGVPVAPDRPCWASTSTWALSYSAVKLFLKNSNLF